MTVTGLRTYEVSVADFPIEVLIEAKNEPVCRAVAGEIQVVRNGALAGTIPVVLTPNGPMAKRFSIPKPGPKPPEDLVCTTHCWFDDDAPDNAKYVITITSASGDTATTTVSVPTINPGIAVLVFQYR